MRVPGLPSSPASLQGSNTFAHPRQRNKLDTLLGDKTGAESEVCASCAGLRASVWEKKLDELLLSCSKTGRARSRCCKSAMFDILCGIVVPRSRQAKVMYLNAAFAGTCVAAFMACYAVAYGHARAPLKLGAWLKWFLRE
jgi:hypothetical protein